MVFLIGLLRATGLRPSEALALTDGDIDLDEGVLTVRESKCDKSRLHDLRHTFAVTTIARWHTEGRDVNQMIPYLSAYLGHGKISDTDWYLTGVTDLLGIVGDSFRTFGLGGEDDEEKC